MDARIMTSISYWSEFGERITRERGDSCHYCKVKVIPTKERWERNAENERRCDNGEMKRQEALRLREQLQDRVATIDHLIPTCRGGAKYDMGNMAVCCFRCNVNKNTKTASEYLQELAQ